MKCCNFIKTGVVSMLCFLVLFAFAQEEGDDVQEVTVSPAQEGVMSPVQEMEMSSVQEVNEELPFIFSGSYKNGDGGIDGLRGAANIAVSTDGTDVYVAGNAEDAISVFTYEQASGLLLFSEVIKSTSTLDYKLGGIWDIALSADGRDIYVSSYKDDAVSVFQKGEDNRIRYLVSYVNISEEISGLNGPREIIISPDGKNVYVASENDNALVIFARDLQSGLLQFQSVIDNEYHQGLYGARGLAINALGDRVYVASMFSHALLEFSRNQEDGSLSLLSTHKNGKDGVYGITGASTVAVSKDDTKIFVTGFNDNALAVFSYDDKRTLVFENALVNGKNNVKGLSKPYKVVTDTRGHVFVSGYGDNAITEYSYVTDDEGTNVFTQISVFEDNVGEVHGIEGAWGVATHPSGRVFVTGYNSNSISIFGISATTGLLAYGQVSYYDNEGTISGMKGSFGIATNKDETHFYAHGVFDNAIAIFAPATEREQGRKLIYSHSATLHDANEGNESIPVSAGVSDVSGITGVWKSVVSPDGKNLYATRYVVNTIEMYTRDPSNGTLSYAGRYKDNENGVEGIEGAYDIVISSDGRYVYVTGYKEDAVTVFQRKEDGTLEFLVAYRDNNGEIDGLSGAYMIAFSPDENYVYVTGHKDDAVVVFNRNAESGTLTFNSVVRGREDEISGLDGAFGIAVHPSGNKVFVVGGASGSLVIFNRNSDGSLKYAHQITSDQEGMQALASAREVAISPDGEYIFLTANSSLVLFRVNETADIPYYLGAFQNEVDGVHGLNAARGLYVSKDNNTVYVSGYYDNTLAVFTRK